MFDLKPDYLFDHYSQITPEWLKKQKIKFILSDLDGTLAPHNEQEEQTFSEWIHTIEKAGTGLIIVSNNKQKRVDDFIQRYKIVGMGNCQKPNHKKIKETYIDKGLFPDTTLFLGDQIFTDVICGKKLGVRTALVTPIKGIEPWVTSCKRGLEKQLLKRWKRM